MKDAQGKVEAFKVSRHLWKFDVEGWERGVSLKEIEQAIKTKTARRCRTSAESGESSPMRRSRPNVRCKRETLHGPPKKPSPFTLTRYQLIPEERLPLNRRQTLTGLIGIRIPAVGEIRSKLILVFQTLEVLTTRAASKANSR